MKFHVLLITIFLAQFSVFASEMKIKGRIAAYMWDGIYVVKTTDGEFVILRRRQTFPTNPVPETALQEKRLWTFSVRDDPQCIVRAGFLRYRELEITCGTEPAENTLPLSTTDKAAFSRFSYLNPEYRNDLRNLENDRILRCFDLNLEKSSPNYKERTVRGVVIGAGGIPLAGFPVSIGYAGEKNRLVYTLTDENGRFSIPIWESLEYWIRPGDTQTEVVRLYRPTRIKKGEKSPSLQLQLIYE